MNHLLKEFRILKHRAWTQVVVVEWLTVMISHKQWALENLKNGVLMNVCIGEVDEYTRFCITCIVNVEVVTSACNTSADIFAVILEIHWEKSDITLWRTDLTDTFDHVFTLFHCRHQVKNCIVAHWHVVEIESKTCSFFGDHS